METFLASNFGVWKKMNSGGVWKLPTLTLLIKISYISLKIKPTALHVLLWTYTVSIDFVKFVFIFSYFLSNKFNCLLRIPSGESKGAAARRPPPQSNKINKIGQTNHYLIGFWSSILYFYTYFEILWIVIEEITA